MWIFDTVIACIELCCWVLMCNLMTIVLVRACMKGVLVLIMVILVDNHDDACWIIMMMMMLVNYICICAYMLLVNFLTCYWWQLYGVSMYWNMLVLIVGVVLTYALLLSHMFMHPYHVGDKYFVFNYSGWLWCAVGIMGWWPHS